MARQVKDRIRLTIPVSPEVHAAFTKMSAASGLPVGRCMGEWLEDTVEGAQLVAAKMEEAKRSPVAVMREVQAAFHGLHGEASDVLADLRRRAADARDGRSAAGRGASTAPSSNTGLNYPSGAPVGVSQGIAKAVKRGARR